MPERETMPTLPSLWMWPGMMPILHLPGEMMPGQFGPISRDFFGLQIFPRLHHVERRNAFGDADDQRNPRVGGFHDGVGRERRRHEDHGGIRAGLVDRFRHGVEDRPAFVRGAALARRHAADNLGAVRLRRPWRGTCLRVR